MSTGGRQRRPGRGTTFATSAAVAVILVALFVVFVVELASNGTVKNQLGEQTFVAGRATDYAPQVTSQGPILLPDLLGKARPVFLQHLGPDPKLGWVVIKAAVPRGPGGPDTCVLGWNQRERRFHDPCTAATYPADGTGLVRYPAVVKPSGRIEVDLRAPLAGEVTVTTGTTPPSTS